MATIPESTDAGAIDAPAVVTAVANEGAVVERGETFFTVDFVDFFPCVDEIVHVTSFVPMDSPGGASRLRRVYCDCHKTVTLTDACLRQKISDMADF